MFLVERNIRGSCLVRKLFDMLSMERDLFSVRFSGKILLKWFFVRFRVDIFGRLNRNVGGVFVSVFLEIFSVCSFLKFLRELGRDLDNLFWFRYIDVRCVLRVGKLGFKLLLFKFRVFRFLRFFKFGLFFVKWLCVRDKNWRFCNEDKEFGILLYNKLLFIDNEFRFLKDEIELLSFLVKKLLERESVLMFDIVFN